jgi:hypothetical protein
LGPTASSGSSATAFDATDRRISISWGMARRDLNPWPPALHAIFYFKINDLKILFQGQTDRKAGKSVLRGSLDDVATNVTSGAGAHTRLAQ